MTDPRDFFNEIIASFVPLEAAARRFLHERTLVEKLPKNSILIDTGQQNDRLYVVYSGLACGYQRVGEVRITTSFFKSGYVIYDPHCFLNQSPVREAVEMLEDTTLVALSYGDLSESFREYPATSDLSFRLVSQYAAIFDERLLAFRTLGGAQLYQWFLDRHPDLYGRVSHRKLASFLGMRHENLSRIQAGRLRAG